MAISKAEGVAYAAGGLSILAALLLRKRIEGGTFANALIFGGGALATGGAMSVYRRRAGNKMIQGVMGHAPLGLSNTETIRRGDKTLRVWEDRQMGIKERVHLLQGLVAKSVKEPDVRQLALAITGHGDRKIQVGSETFQVKGAGCPARDDMCEAKAIFNWVADPKNVRYTGDVGEHALYPGGPVEAVDLFTTARRGIENRGEDCDGHSIISATLAINNGFPAKFRITSNTGDSWDHIYTMVGVPKLNPSRWIALDSTLGTGKFNKQPARKKEVDFAA